MRFYNLDFGNGTQWTISIEEVGSDLYETTIDVNGETYTEEVEKSFLNDLADFIKEATK